VRQFALDGFGLSQSIVRSMSDRKPFLTAEWRWLAMLNYSVAPDVLEPFVPKGTVLDTFQGTAYVSMVGFLFLNTRVRGLSIPWHRDFEEVNLRFYVRRQAEEGWRRGVVFIKEIVPRLAIAAVARVFYNENYVALSMRHKLERSGPSPALRAPSPPVDVVSARTLLPLPVRNERGEGGGEGHPTAHTRAHVRAVRPSSPQPSPPSAGGEETGALNTYPPVRERDGVRGTVVEYAWRYGGQWCRLAVMAGEEAHWPAAGSLEEFITEHYWGYAAQRDGECVEYRVEHPRWRVWRAEESVFECGVAGLYGAQFAGVLEGEPASAFLAEGSEVAVFPGRRT
jgi:uncharacterized protein YqjF (DUF2071 family)